MLATEREPEGQAKRSKAANAVFYEDEIFEDGWEDVENVEEWEMWEMREIWEKFDFQRVVDSENWRMRYNRLDESGMIGLTKAVQ